MVLEKSFHKLTDRLIIEVYCSINDYYYLFVTEGIIDIFNPPFLQKEYSSGEGNLEGIFWFSAPTSSAAFGESAFRRPSVCISFTSIYNGTKPEIVA